MEVCPYWRTEDHLAAKNALSFRALGSVLYQVLLRMPHGPEHPIHEVCGPITSGGFNDANKNAALMRHAIVHLRAKGHLVLDQTPLRPHVSRLHEQWKHHAPEGGYCWEILHEIYLPIFETGLVRVFHFLPGWESSWGTQWERRKAMAFGYDLRAFPKDEYERLVMNMQPA